jgi:hypothetical protein
MAPGRGARLKDVLDKAGFKKVSAPRIHIAPGFGQQDCSPIDILRERDIVRTRAVNDRGQ